MSYTKRQYIEAALEEIGMAAYTFDLQPEQIESGVRRLDAMIAEWNGRGLRLSYPLPGSPENSDIDAETNVPDYANEAIITGLALRLAPSYGKNVSTLTMSRARMAYDVVLAKSAVPIEMQFPSTLPLGSGNKPYRRDANYFPEPVDPVLTGPEGPLNFN